MKRILLSLAAIATALPAAQAITFVVRPTVAYVNPEGGDRDAAGYLGVAAGIAIGAKGQHEFTAEIGFTGWDREKTSTVIRIKGTETYVPVLASYRFYLQPVDSKVRFYVTPSLGFTEVRYEAEVTQFGALPGVVNEKGATSAFTAAIGAGVDFHFNDKLSLSVGYRYLGILDNNSGFVSPSHRDFAAVDGLAAHIVSVGLNIRFR